MGLCLVFVCVPTPIYPGPLHPPGPTAAAAERAVPGRGPCEDEALGGGGYIYIYIYTHILEHWLVSSKSCKPISKYPEMHRSVIAVDPNQMFSEKEHVQAMIKNLQIQAV